MKRIIAIIILYIACIGMTNAQEGSLFDYQIQRLDDQNYTMQMQLSENSNTQYIQIHFFEKGVELVIYEASINKKKDGNYYLYFEGVENLVFLDNITFQFNHDFGMLKEPSVVVRLIDKDFNQIDTYQQTIQ
ncbi:hypothetical protein [Flagellimonas sp. CMM7]|uniref:hypothetical protein n=1 Tax=Flagellimonas sp. CMM7 TaxID=2654676 RepID=UPI0013D17C7E|nr:hypothetical protein [Flagellimonas sp. CMM7]UII80113.1 hypothetical protein LV704_00995 [Flagellimonas sp. CMM7]